MAALLHRSVQECAVIHSGFQRLPQRFRRVSELTKALHQDIISRQFIVGNESLNAPLAIQPPEDVQQHLQFSQAVRLGEELAEEKVRKWRLVGPSRKTGEGLPVQSRPPRGNSQTG